MRVMGVDLGIKKAAFSVWEDDILVYTDAFESHALDRASQLDQVSAWLFISDIRAQADYIVIEDTLIGNNRKYSIRLAQMMGACLAALAEKGDHILLANVGHWKKEVLGNGHADKVAIRSYVNEMSMAYSALCGDDQDQFDAACIGYYGVLLTQRLGDTADAG